MWDNTWVVVVTVVCGFQQRGVTISGNRHPVLPKKPLGSSTFLDISIISLSVYSVYWMAATQYKKLLNRTIHGPMYKWSQRCVWWWLGVWIWCQGICSHHIYGVTFSSFHIVTQKIYNSVHPCEKVIGMFFHNPIWSRLLDMNRLCLVCIKRSIDEVTKCQISKLGYHQRRSDEILKEARCQFCDVKFGHRVMEAVVFFDHGMHNFIQNNP